MHEGNYTEAFMERFISTLPRSIKQAIWLVLDAVLVGLCLYLAFALRLGRHRIKLSALERHALSRIGIVAVLMMLSAMALSYLLNSWAPRSVPFIFGMLFFCSAVGQRLLALGIINGFASWGVKRMPVAIYGAGVAGIQLASALRQNKDMQPAFFVDDNVSLYGLIVSGLKVFGPDSLPQLHRRKKFARVLLAMPSISRRRQALILGKLEQFNCEVQVIPSYEDLIAGKDLSEGLRTVTPDDLLGRDMVDLDIPDVAKIYAGKVVMVTGAGGSIGSELCRQLIGTRPDHIVLYEQSEFALYQIDQDIRDLANGLNIKITSRLGSVTDAARVTEIIKENAVAIILHAAAYKHVPLVEDNPFEGVRNNVLGTLTVAKAAQGAKVDQFILVSTDKAVRPTNVMGASKRMAELVVQDLQTRSQTTKFAMVRFGNVLGSSGSVIPLFERQIRRGGPVTVTDPEVTRFFMTIPEASRLVLLAGAYAEGGDVFVLDMGAPKKIVDIARRMIELTGRSVRENGKGDIEIVFTGLRPGEKLYEELLIDDYSLRKTPHPKIMRAEEKVLSASKTSAMVTALQKTKNPKELLQLISKFVDGYHSPHLK